MNFLKQYIFIISLATFSTILGCPHDQETIFEITTQNVLKNLLTQSQGPIIISLYRQNCTWCTKMKPIIDRLAAEQEFNDICFYRADGNNLKAAQDEDSIATNELVQQAIGHNIPGYPFLLFMNHGNFITKQIGTISEDELRKKIEKAFPNTINK